ncbi:MAG: cupin domain-containing protein [Polyangiaceae bacterium]
MRTPLDPAAERVFDVALGPGEALFIPAAWIHEVTALAPSLTLSFLTFPWPNHFHWLGPPGSDDARPEPA